MKISLKALVLFNYVSLHVSNLEQIQDKLDITKHNLRNSSSFKMIFKQIGKIYHFSCILYKNYSQQFEQIFLQTIDTISTYGDIGFEQTIDNLANKTVLFLQDGVSKNIILNQKKELKIEKQPIQNLNSHVFTHIEKQSEESEQRLNQIVATCNSKLRRSSSDSHISLQRGIDSSLSKDIEISFQDYNSSTQRIKDNPHPIPSLADVKITVKNSISNNEKVINFGMYERNRSYYLENPDDWAEKMIK